MPEVEFEQVNQGETRVLFDIGSGALGLQIGFVEGERLHVQALPGQGQRLVLVDSAWKRLSGTCT